MKYQGLVWAGIDVENLESSVSFYRDILGLPLLGKGEDWAHFDSGAETLLELFTGGRSRQEPKKPEQQGIVLGLWVEDLDHAVAELKQKGVHFLPAGAGEIAGTPWAHFQIKKATKLRLKKYR